MQLYTVETAAPLIGCGVATLYRRIKAGAIGYRRIGKKILFTENHIENFLKSIEVLPRVKNENA